MSIYGLPKMGPIFEDELLGKDSGFGDDGSIGFENCSMVMG